MEKKGMKKERVLLSWSGGKDSAVALFELKSPEYRIDGLITVVEQPSQRLKIHEVPIRMIEQQAASLELPLYKVLVPENATNDEYEKAIGDVVEPLKKKGLQGIAYGDLFLEDIKAYRDALMQKLGLKGVYPLWKWKQEEVLRVFFGLGFKGFVTTVDLKALPASFVGRAFQRDFINDLPSKVDPCGENGEFHTFVFDGPFFQQRVPFQFGDRGEKNGFAFQDFKLG